jgi:cytochrome c peroxidase
MKRSELKSRLCLGVALAMLLFVPGGCLRTNRENSPAVVELRARIQKEFPAEDHPPIPENNPQTPEKVRLGEALFFDPNLSSCGTVACATCHLPDEGFSDGRRISRGCAGATGRRNSNSISNTAYLSHLFWDGRVQSLEQQALGPVVDPVEMANTWDNVIHYLSTGEHPVTGESFPDSSRFYASSFEAVFSGEITSNTVAKAIAAYERTLVSRDAPFDRWLQGDNSALSPKQKRGALVFFGRGRCSECHKPPNFTDSDFHNVAVPQVGFEKAGMFPDNARICGGVADNVDPGRAEVTFLHSSCADVGRFKTPGLRNVELSAPYMHNGAFSSLDSVLQHYWNVGRGTGTPVAGDVDAKARLIRLTSFGGHPEDFENLIEFMKSLTGTQMAAPPGGIAPPRPVD